MREMVCGRPPGSGGSAPQESRHSMVAGMVLGAGGGTTLDWSCGAGVTGGAEEAVDSAVVIPGSALAQALVRTLRPVAPASQSALRRLRSFAGLSGSNAHMTVTIVSAVTYFPRFEGLSVT